MKHIFLLIVIVVMLCSACGKKISSYTAQEIYQSIAVQRDDFKKTTTYYGPEIYEIANDRHQAYRIFAVKPYGDTVPDFYIRITSSYPTRDGLKHFTRSYDSDGKQVQVIDTTVKIQGYYYSESSLINASPKYLVDHMKEGLRFKLSGSGDSNVMFFPSQYIAAMLSLVK